MKTYAQSEITRIGVVVLACTTSVSLTGAFMLLRSRKLRKDKQNALEAVWYEVN